MTKYLIWSNEHGAWWRPNECGYCTDVAQAGRYTKEKAEQICLTARSYIKNEPPPEVMIDEREVTFNADDVSETMVEEIEFAVGMGCNAWDTIDPKAIIAAAWNRCPPAKTYFR